MSQSTAGEVLAPNGASPPAASRASGLARLALFIDEGLDHYAQARHQDPGPGTPGGVSELSRWIRPRLVLDSEVAAAALHRPDNPGRAKFLEQLCWRTYWKAFLEYHPNIWSQFVAGARYAPAREIARALERAVEGRTGIDAFDGWLSELRSTGHLHNQARLGFASIWVHTLKLPWEHGAALFLEHLLDGDPASNTLSWRWVAGLHTQGKAYLTTTEIIRHCSYGRYAPDGLAIEPHAIRALPPQQSIPAPPVSLPEAPFGLLLTPEDLHPESLPGVSAGVAGIATLSIRAPFAEAPSVAAFRRDGLADGAARARAAFNQRVSSLGGADELVDYARSLGVRHLAIARPFVGPAQDALLAVAGQLAAANIVLVPLGRAWDAIALSESPAGFFRFRRRLDALLASTGVGRHGDPLP